MQEKSEYDGVSEEESDEYIFYLLTQVQNRRNRDCTPKLDNFRVTTTHWRVMSTVHRLGCCLMSDLAEFTTIDRTTLTRTIDNLVLMKLMERRALPDDRRLVQVILTERGRSVLDGWMGRVQRHNRKILAGLRPDEIEGLENVLIRILRNLIRDDEIFDKIVRFQDSM